jgi:serine/threonine protein kinase
VTSRVAGSPLFLSPELFDLNQIYDADRIKEILYKNDVWSLGMTISKLITEKLFPWWKASNMDELVDALNPPFFEVNLRRAYNILDAEKGQFPELVEFIKQMLTSLDKRPSVSNALAMFKTHYFPESCVKCENVASKVCSKCSVPYCSDECQVSAWSEHRNICGKK